MEPLTVSPATRTSAASDAPTHDPNSRENKKKKHWIEIKLLDEEDQPVNCCIWSIYVDKSPPSQEEDEKPKMILKKR